MVKVNFAEIKDFEPLPVGRYHFMVTDVDSGETGEDSKKPGSPYWTAQCTVQDGPHQGRTQNVWIGLPPNYEPFGMVNILRVSVGQHQWSEEELKQGEFDVEMDDLLNLEFVGVVRKQRKSKEGYTEIGRMEPFDADTWEPESEEDSLLP
jgi:hypothetical protein